MLARALGKTIRWARTSVVVRNARFYRKRAKYAFEPQICVIVPRNWVWFATNVPSTWQDILIRTEIDCTSCRNLRRVWLRCLPNCYHSNLASRSANKALRLDSAIFHTPFELNSCEFDSRHQDDSVDAREWMPLETQLLRRCCSDTILALSENAQLHTCADTSSNT